MAVQEYDLDQSARRSVGSSFCGLVFFREQAELLQPQRNVRGTPPMASIRISKVFVAYVGAGNLSTAMSALGHKRTNRNIDGYSVHFRPFRSSDSVSERSECDNNYCGEFLD
jgi:hypothetical protein